MCEEEQWTKGQTDKEEGAPKCGSMHLTERWTDGRTEHPKVGACVTQNGQGKTRVHEKLDNTHTPPPVPKKHVKRT